MRSVTEERSVTVLIVINSDMSKCERVKLFCCLTKYVILMCSNVTSTSDILVEK